MKVAIFENEFDEMKQAFTGFNLFYYQKSIAFEVFPSTQAFGDLKKLKDYDYILVDIDLSKNSELDGFQLIEKILRDDEIKAPKLIILTGQPPIKEKLKDRKLPDFPIVYKPLIYTLIQESFLKAKSLEHHRGTYRQQI